MNPINSIKARLESRKNTKNSCYWEYAKYFSDGILWEDTFFFESFGGGNFQCNPYYIYKELLNGEEYKDYKVIIAHKDPEALKKDLEERGLFNNRVSVVKVGTKEYRNALSHSKYLINNVGFNMDFIKKEGQVYLNTWHGTPLKTLGKSVKGDPFACINAQRNFLMCDYLIAPNELTKGVYENEHTVKGLMKGELYLGAYPRNSVFFDKEYQNKIKERFGFENVKSIFYMPTWRGNFCDGAKSVDQVSEMERLAKELGDGYKVFVKFHPAMQGASTEFKYCYKMPDGVEVYEFLNAVDILITDYSSVFFDFASTDKKVVLYQYDKEEYFKDRGVYKEADESLCFDIAYNYDQLKEYVLSDKINDYTEFKERFCWYDNINGAKQALQKLTSGKEKNGGEAVDLYLINFPITEKELFSYAEKLKGTRYLFVFVLGRTQWNFDHFAEIEYSALNTYNRLSPKERRKERRLKFSFFVFRRKKALEKLKEFAKRERKRIWGDMKINHIYAKNKKLPTAVRYDTESWPKHLD